MEDYKQPETGIGSVEETNRLLSEASKQTGISAPTFSPTGAISSESLSGGATPIDLTGANDAYNNAQTDASVKAAGVSGGVGAKIDTAQKNIQDEITRQATEAKENKTTVNKGLLESLGLGKAAVDEKLEARQSPEFLAKQKASNDAYSSLQQSRQSKTNELQALQGAALNDVQRNARTNEINNRYALQDANLSVSYDVANRDYQSAINNINTIAQIKIDAAQPYVNYYTALLNDANIDWNNAEKNILEQKKSEYTTLQTNATEVSKAYQTLLTNNPDAITPALANQLKNVENVAEFNDILARNGISLQNPLEAENQMLTNENLRSQINERNAKTTGRGSGIISTTRQKLDAEGNVVKDGQGNPVMETVQTSLPLAQAQANVELLTGLTSDKNIRTAVGPTGLARLVGAGFDRATGGRQNFIASVEQIRSNLNLEALIGAKARGATFGALSDQELQVLASSASKIGSWAKKDDSGNVVAYNASEKDFKRELDKINNFAKLDYVLKGGAPEDVGAVLMTDGIYYTQNSDGSFTQLTN